MKQPATGSRLGPVLTMLVILALNVLLSGRYKLAPDWAAYVAAALMLGPMLIRLVFKGQPLWVRVERITTLTTIVLVLGINTFNLADVVDELLFHTKDLQPLSLVSTAISIWIANMLAFTLLYWAIDRGGPDARDQDEQGYPDFDFPATDDPRKLPPDWRPGYIDYLFIGFTTSTAFGPTEAMPLTARAKVLIIVQSTISLVTIVVVAARAIGILQ